MFSLKKEYFRAKAKLRFVLLQQADLLLYAVIPSSWRYSAVDLTWPYLFDALSFLIPVPDEDAANIYAAIKPFQWPVILTYIHLLLF